MGLFHLPCWRGVLNGGLNPTLQPCPIEQGGSGGDPLQPTNSIPAPASDLQRDQLSSYLAAFDMQEAHADEQLEAPRPGAAGVEVEHSVALFV